MAFNRAHLVMGIGVVTLKSGCIPSSKKCSLELAFNKDSDTPQEPGCAVCRPHSHVVYIFKNHIEIGFDKGVYFQSRKCLTVEA